MFDVDSYSFYGPVVYNGSKYEKLEIEDLAKQPVTQSVEKGWLAAIQHHFLAAAVPPAAELWSYEGRFAEGRFPGQRDRTTADGCTGRFSELQDPALRRPEDAGTAGGHRAGAGQDRRLRSPSPCWPSRSSGSSRRSTTYVGNWGLAIIICTLLIKLVFYKLSETSGRSMARMRQMQPRMKALQERYKDDKQALSTAMMDLYKKEKINPAAGCLPMLVQIPFFMAFYWVLLESVEMRQAPFMLWITDLSSRDPYFVLPLLMGAAMWFQQKLNPPPPDPVQAKMMQAMPIMMTGMFAFFPAGLVVYWLTNSVLSIAQQWRINKVLGAN